MTALAGVAQLIEHCPANPKVTGSILHQDTCLGCGFPPQLGQVQEATDQCFSHQRFSPSPSPSLPLSLKPIKEKIF